jgi:hypothetical protein
MTNLELARLFRIIADGREEYSKHLAGNEVPEAGHLLIETAAYRSAALIAEGDMSGVFGLLPSWRMTPEVEELMRR